jgi:hypothetical protein
MTLDSSDDEDGDAAAISEPRVLSSLNGSRVRDENLPEDVDMAEKEVTEKEPRAEEIIPSPLKELVSDEGLLTFNNFE